MFKKKSHRVATGSSRVGVACAGAPLVVEALEPRRVMSASVFTGAGGNALWSNAANWSGGTLPGVNNDVLIASTTSAQSVVLDVAIVRVKSLSLNDRLIINRGSSLSVTGDLDLASEADLRINGLVNWAAGQWESGAKSIVNAGGALNIGSSANPTQGSVTIGNDLVNAGRVAWRGGGITLDGSLTNSASKSLDASAPMVITGDGLLTNFGLLRRGGLATTTTTIDVDFNNDGRVFTLRGTLEIGRDDPDVPSNIDLGVWSTLSTGATVVLRSPTIHADVRFGGVGQYRFVDYTHIFRGATAFTRTTFESDAPIYIDNRGATFGGAAVVEGAPIELEAGLVVAGSLTVVGSSVQGNFQLGVSGTLTLQDSSIASDVRVSHSGTMETTGATTINADLTNLGTIRVAGGVLEASVTGLNRSGVFENVGTLILASGGRLEVVGDLDSTGVIETFITPGSFGQITTSGDMDLSGTLRARFSGSFPTLSTFNVLSAGGTRTGSFSTFTPLGVPAGKAAVALYSPTGVSVRLS